MGFWPFGREPSNIELVSRVITGSTQNGYRLRGKLTVHFMEPQRQSEADLAGDRVSAIATALIREAPDHERVIGAEVQLAAELTARYPVELPRARALDLAALHVVGDPALSGELRRASSVSGPASSVAISGSQMPASVRPSSGPASSVAISGSQMPASVRPSSGPPPAPTSAPPGPTSSVPGSSARRRGTSQIRSVQSLMMPPGATPAAMSQFVVPHVRDSAARILIGFLRAHDLIAVRGVTFDEGSAEVLATLVPASNAPPGGYEASRAGEIARWQTTLGQGVMFALQREVHLAAAYLTKDAFVRVEVKPAVVDTLLESICQTAFPDDAGLVAEVSQVPGAMAAGYFSLVAQNLTRIAGGHEEPALVASSLAPLFGMVQEDLTTLATIIKHASG